MRTSTSAVTAVLLLGLVATACRFDGATDPPPFDVADEEAELAALDIGVDEPVADEDDLSVPEDEAAPLDEYGEPILDASGELAENPVADDDEPDADADDADADDADADDADADLGALALRPAIAPDAIPKSEARMSIGAKTWRCRQKTKRSCVCKGSPLNCELPSEQPGRNRFIPPAEVAQIDRRGGDKMASIEAIGRWEIANDTPIYDGTGHRRGQPVRSACYAWAGSSGAKTKKIDGKTCVKINFGQKKTMQVDGESTKRTYVYAFSVSIAGKLPASSWIPLSKVVRKNELAKMPTIKTAKRSNLSSASYVVKSARDWGQSQATFSADKLPSWAQSKVAKGNDSSKRARDYLLRDGNVINLAFHTPRVGGAATDTLFVADDALAFKRARSTAEVPTLVRVRLFDPKKKSMIFAYGSIGGRFGWLPLAAFKKGTVKSSVRSKDSCLGKPDGLHCSELAPWSGYFCEGGTVAGGLQCGELSDRCQGLAPSGQRLVCAK
ncbi:MAG: hypothetical protein KF764_00320 [Labilithrix sp.]|nr:hypothetical protein [Labilithrix sp.]